ncbi:MAG: sodium:solute symporter family protein [Proteobacteria bacterium]|nr:sodium:solute symporter family protein [Pseudomonadota bacterium]
MADFVMPRRFGKAMMLMHAFGTGTHSDQAVSVASKTYTNGLTGIWYQWLYLFCTPFYWLIAPIMRRFRALTTADVFEARYDRSVSILFAVVGLLWYTVNMGVMLKGSGAVIDAGTGGQISSDAAIILMTILFVVYGMAGGLSAAIVTDFIQGILTIIFSFLLLPYVLEAVDGLAGLHREIPKIVTDKDMFSLVAPGEIGLFYIVMIAINALVGIVAQPHTMSNCAAVRNELDGQIGYMGGNFVKRICTIAWCLTGLAAVSYFGGADIHPDMVYGKMARDFLPAIMPGLLGIFLAALVASVMSTCDSFMIASSGLFAENLYRPLLPGKSPRHYLLVARASALVVVGSSVAFAYWLDDVIAGLEIVWKVASMMGVAFWLGLFWRKTTVAGAWASTLSGFAMWWLTTRDSMLDLLDELPFSQELQFVVETGSGLSIYLPWQMFFYLTAALMAGVLVSLFTRPVDGSKLDTFYALTRTPVTGEAESKAPCTLPEGAVIPPRRVLFDSSYWEIPIPSRKSIAGFAIGWLLVGAIVSVFYMIARG